MELNVKYVRFELENCQHVTVRIDNLERFELEGICENDSLMPCVRKNVIDRTWRCRKMTVCISKEADKKIEFWDKVDGFTNFERLTAYNDIVSITYLDDAGLTWNPSIFRGKMKSLPKEKSVILKTPTNLQG